MSMLIQKPLFVKKSPIHGYGVFAGEDFNPGEIVEECYTILSNGEDKTLKNYYFFCYENKTGLTTGYGLIYNHSDMPNMNFFYDEARSVTIFSATKPISKGEELMIRYGDSWFSHRNMRVKKMPVWHKIQRYLKGAPFRASVVIGGLYFIYYLIRVLPVPSLI